MLIRLYSPLSMMDIVCSDITRVMDNESFSGVNIHLIPGFLLSGLSQCFENILVLCKVLIIFCFGCQCNKIESGLKTHKPCHGFVQLSLSEIR